MVIFVVFGSGGKGGLGARLWGWGGRREGQGVEERGREGMGEGWDGFEEFEILGLFRHSPPFPSSLHNNNALSSSPREW